MTLARRKPRTSLADLIAAADREWRDGDEDEEGFVMVREYGAAGFDVSVLPGLVLAPTSPVVQH